MLEKLPINWALVANPTNWLTVLLMVTIGTIAFSLILGASAQKGQ